MTDYVIDASSVLAFAFAEPGADIVTAIAASDGNRLLISTVNLAEALSKLIDKGMSLVAAESVIGPLALEEISFDGGQARTAAGLRGLTRSLGLSFGDRSCLALAVMRGGPVLTADRQWLAMADVVGVEIVVTRPERN